MTTFEPKIYVRPNPKLDIPSRDAPARTEPLRTEPSSLIQAVQVAVQEIVEHTLWRVARTDTGLAFRPRSLLAVITYCYAREVYGSEAVEDLIRRDTEFRQLCRDEFPDARLIRAFRKHNREAVSRCLVAALRHLATQARPVAGPPASAEAALAEEADHRLTKAMFIDRMELDEQ